MGERVPEYELEEIIELFASVLLRINVNIGDEEYERLEKLTGFFDIKKPCEEEIPSKEPVKWENNLLQKLADYEYAEEQGLLLRLPCKIGDSVYEIYRDGEYCSSWLDIRQRKFTLAFYEKHLNDFGKTVFLTREEAEEKLKEMEKTMT